MKSSTDHALGHLLVAIGSVFVITSAYRLGFYCAFMGDCFGTLLKETVTGFPFKLCGGRSDVYVGSAMVYLGLALSYWHSALVWATQSQCCSRNHLLQRHTQRAAVKLSKLELRLQWFNSVTRAKTRLFNFCKIKLLNAKVIVVFNVCWHHNFYARVGYNNIIKINYHSCPLVKGLAHQTRFSGVCMGQLCLVSGWPNLDCQERKKWGISY